MILLIGGESCTGKTILAQRLLERRHIPYLSLDHLKMGLIRGLPGCGFTALDPDEAISETLWPIAEGIIETNLENGQRLILEGCYLPQTRVKRLLDRYPGRIAAAYLGFSARYISTHFEDGILAHRSDLEKRLYQETRSAAELVAQHERTRLLCRESGLPYFEIDQDWERGMAEAAGWFGQRLGEDPDQRPQ